MFFASIYPVAPSSNCLTPQNYKEFPYLPNIFRIISDFLNIFKSLDRILPIFTRISRDLSSQSSRTKFEPSSQSSQSSTYKKSRRSSQTSDPKTK
jgi:hypothetical protein